MTFYLVQLTAPLFTVLGLKMLFDGASYVELMKSMRQEKGLSYGLGMIVLLACTAVILVHNIWEWSVAGFLTFIAWAGAVKAVLLILKPEVLLRKWSYIENKTLMALIGLVITAIGVYYFYLGFFA